MTMVPILEKVLNETIEVLINAFDFQERTLQETQETSNLQKTPDLQLQEDSLTSRELISILSRK